MPKREVDKDKIAAIEFHVQILETELIVRYYELEKEKAPFEVGDRLRRKYVSIENGKCKRRIMDVIFSGFRREGLRSVPVYSEILPNGEQGPLWNIDWALDWQEVTDD